MYKIVNFKERLKFLIVYVFKLLIFVTFACYTQFISISKIFFFRITHQNSYFCYILNIGINI